MSQPQITLHQFHSALRTALLLAALCLLPAAAVFAADVVTDGDMEAVGIANWPHSDVTATNSSAKAGDQVGGGAQSLKGTSVTGRRTNVEWYNAQTVGVVNSTDTVLLSLWWGGQFSHTGGGANGTLSFDVKAASGSWTTAWSTTLNNGITSFQSGTVTNQDVSSSFATTESYDIRLRFVGRTGNNNGAVVYAWWDDVVLDASAPNQAPTVVINNPVDATSIGGGASYTIDGTADDTDGTVTALDLTIQRQDSSEYWNGAGWQVGSTTVAATNDGGDYDTWSYSWNWTTDMDGVSVSVLATATDDLAAPGTDTNTATVDTRAPQIATGVRFQTLPASGDASFTLLSDWTEANPGTPEFDYNLNAAGYLGFVAGSAGNASSKNFAVAPDGDDSFSAIKSRHADSYTNGPTLSEDTSTVYVEPLTPPAPGVGNPTANSLDVTVNENGSENGSGMLYAIQCDTTGQYVQADGTLGASEVWRTLAAWGSPVTVTGLSPATTYDFSVAAGNPGDATPTPGENSASAYGATGSDTTSGAGNPSVQPQTATSSVAGCVITIDAPFIDDSDADSTTTILAKQSGTCNPGGYATVGCDGLGGASPRSCIHDTGTASTSYCYEVNFTDDPEGVNTASESNPQYVGPVTTAAVCTLTDNSVEPGTASATVKRCNRITVKAPFDLDLNTNSTTTFERGPSDTGPWAPICSNVVGFSPRTCDDTTVAASSTYYYRVSFSDGDGVYDPNPQVVGPYVTPACEAGDADDTTVDSNSATASSCKQITATSALTGDGDGDGWTLVEYFDGSWKTACATLTGAPARQCLIPGLSASTSYDVRITHSDPDGVTSTPPNPETLNVSTPACAADQSPPMVLFLAPAWDAIVGGTDRIKVQVYEPAIQSQGYQVDGVGGPYTAAVANLNYTCGTDCTVYEFDLDTVALALTNDRHFLSFRVVDNSNNETIVTRPFRVNNTAGEAAGGGKLLRRMASAQLCIDCHDLPTHSSQMTSFKYGGWSVDCLSCHTPHLTTNIYLIREQILTPKSGPRAVSFTARTTGTDYTTPAATYTGICEVCHTRTTHHRNDDSAGADHSHGEASSCTGCHGHDVGFSGAGGACNGCHNAPPNEGSHAQHTINSLPTSYSDATFNSTAAEYGFACVKCHNGAAHPTDTNDPHQVEVAGESSVPDTTALAYARDPYGSGIGSEQGPNNEWWEWDDGTCSNVYCHGNFTGGIPANTYTWSVNGVVGCGDCHKASNADPPTTGSHQKHTSSGTYNLDCVTCHRGTASGGAITSKMVHVNGYLDWNLNNEGDSRIAASSTYEAANSGQTSTFGTFSSCTNLYCHSPGDKTSDFNPPNGGALVWGTGSATCTSCHPSPPTSVDKANSHPVHSSYNCIVCHSSVVNATPAIIDQGLHVNGAYEVAAGGGYSFSPSGSPTTCASNSCHGNLTWGSTGSTCRNCHMVSNAGTSDDNEIYNAGTAIVDGNEWLATGHGSASAFTNESGNAAPDFDNGGRDGCAYCHSTGVGHNDTDNPYRLANTGGGDGKTGVCLICHKTGAAGYNPGSGNVVATGTPINARHLGLKHGTGDKGGTFCWDCHDPHGDAGDTGTSLAYMIQRNPVEVHAGDTGATTWGIPATPASDLAATPDFRRNRDGTDSWTWGDYVVDVSYDGVCQVCHDDTSEYTKGSYSTHNAGSRCTEACHKHDQGTDDAFKGAGSCIGCHSTGGSGVGGANSRRAIEGDFDLQSHHVGAAQDTDGNPLYTQPNMGGKLTDADCVVCHAEGTMSGGEASIDSNYHQKNGPYGGCTQATPCIDLKDADNVASVYSYNRDAVAASAGAAGNWNSGNATWASETSTNLDPFCLTCHDGDGAQAVTAGDIGEAAATAANPFNDAAITNEVDQLVRGSGAGAVVDVASRVADAWRVGPGGGPAYSAQDRDTDAGRLAQNIDDPPLGIYSRHAIRGQSTSVYTTASGGIPAAFWAGSWEDDSVMGCADCHTTDGANTTDGNAHGATSEYLLKDELGLASEGLMELPKNPPPEAARYGCLLCHAADYYATDGNNWDHTANSADYQDYSGNSGSARLQTGSKGGSIYGMACTNCHGGAVGGTQAAPDSPPEFGTIHGTSQVFGVGVGGASSTREAYRFMNGNSMRFYDPGGWSGTSITCYTLSANIDGFGGCTKHGNSGAGHTKPFSRNLSY